ncbi:MAG: hypothetical protein HPY66_1703 [Firmicutes bacterium]|nr:hypothetical protein [Bacillota bacterium]
MERDAKHDLGLCELTTEGPWYIDKIDSHDNSGPSATFYLVKSEHAANKDKIVADMILHGKDAEFIAMSREALPYWIKRAQEFEQDRTIDDLLEKDKTLLRNKISVAEDQINYWQKRYHDERDKCAELNIENEHSRFIIGEMNLKLNEYEQHPVFELISKREAAEAEVQRYREAINKAYPTIAGHYKRLVDSGETMAAGEWGEVARALYEVLGGDG